MSYAESRGRGVASFVRDTGRDAYWRALTDYRATLRDDQGRVLPELLEEVECAVCGPEERRAIFAKDGFGYVRCCGCGTVFISPQLRDGPLDSYWRKSPVSAGWLAVLLTPAQQEFDRRKFDGVLARLEDERGGPGRVLDIGSSVGSFLDVARGRGWEVEGTEPGSRARALAREQFGLELHQSLDTVEGVFDVVAFWEVVEHVKDPVGLLRAARSKLADGGILVSLVGGNAGSVANRVMRAESAAFDFARLWYFTPSSFAQLLTRAELEQTGVEGVLAEIDVLVNYLRYDDPYAPVFEEHVLSHAAVAALTGVAETADGAYKFLSFARRA